MQSFRLVGEIETYLSRVLQVLLAYRIGLVLKGKALHEIFLPITYGAQLKVWSLIEHPLLFRQLE